MNEVEKVTQQVPERRSERLKKDANLTTLEKTERAAQRKNLEGSPKISNSFVVSSVDDISHISSDMGVVIDSDVFYTCNLLNDLEKARSDLYLKQLEQNDAPPAVTVVENIDKEKKIPELIWLEDESSTSEDFIFVESRKKKDRTRNLSSSLLNQVS